jgi:carbonic anhydrase/acetyltransferase-like protein (isoleucine patch superfamily)
VIEPDASVGHGAIVHGCTLRQGCLVGMGATVLSGADVGAGALVAAGAVVREGEVIPPRTLAVGVPARDVRTIDEDAGRAPAARYRARAVVYREELGG